MRLFRAFCYLCLFNYLLLSSNVLFGGVVVFDFYYSTLTTFAL